MNRRKNRNRHKKTPQQEKGFCNVKLTVAERLVLANLLPAEESYAGMVEIRKLKAHLAFSGEEAQEIELTQDAHGIKWNNEKAIQIVKDIPMGEWMTNVIRGILREKNGKNALAEREMSLYEKFIIDYDMV